MKHVFRSVCVGLGIGFFAVSANLALAKVIIPAPVVCVDAGCNATGAGCTPAAATTCNCRAVPPPGQGAPFPTYCHTL